MNKSELVAHVAEKAGISKAKAGESVDAVLDGIAASLKKGGEVTLVGFGTFRVSKRAARNGRNPRTGETIKIAESKTVNFKVGATLKNAL